MLHHFYDGDEIEQSVLLKDETAGYSARAVLGEVDIVTVYVDDPDASLNFVGKKRWWITEDECDEDHVWRGYVGRQRISRKAGASQQFVGVGRRWEIELVEDNNVFTRHVLQAVNDPDRPAETFDDRLAWLFADGGLDYEQIRDWGGVEGSVLDLDAYDWTNQTDSDVLQSLALATGHNFYMRYNHDHDDEPDLFFYDAETNNTIDAPTSGSLLAFGVSNDLATIDYATRWPPSDAATLERSPDRIATGILVAYTGGVAYRPGDGAGGRPDSIDTYGLIDLVTQAPEINTAATAEALGDRLLWQHSEQELRIRNVTVTLPAANLNDVKHGQLIATSFTHLQPAGWSAQARVLSKSFRRPANLSEEYYEVTLELAPTADAALPCAALDALSNPITNTADGFYAPLLATAPTSRADGLILYLRPGLTYHQAPYPSFVGAWHFPVYNSGGVDYAGDCAGNQVRCFVVGPGTITIHTNQYSAARTLKAVLYFGDYPEGYVTEATQAAGTDFVFAVPDDGECIHWVDIYDTEAACGNKWGFSGFDWVGA